METLEEEDKVFFSDASEIDNNESDSFSDSQVYSS